jgi:MscS family membrane protein
LVVQFIIFASAAAAGDPYPLRPPDTSSPRATLQGFIAALDEAYVRFGVLISKYAASNRLYLSAQEWRSQREALVSGLKAVQFMDLSQVSPVLHDIVAPDRAIQLKEIFDRIEIPPFEEIPDRAAMEGSSAKRWRLPNTGIEIALIENGPRAGEYLISAATIDRVPGILRTGARTALQAGASETAERSLPVAQREPDIHDPRCVCDIAGGVSMIVPPRWMLNLPGWAGPHQPSWRFGSGWRSPSVSASACWWCTPSTA